MAVLVLLGYGMKASVVDTAAVMSDAVAASANNVVVGYWDTIAPTAGSLRIANGGGTNNSPDTGDVIAIDFNEAIDLATIKSGWDGTATALTVTISDNDPGYSNNDIVTFDVNLGVIDLGGAGYTSAPSTILSATMEWNSQQDKIEVTLGSYVQDNSGTSNARTTATFHPDSGIQDTGGISIDTAVTPTKKDRHF